MKISVILYILIPLMGYFHKWCLVTSREEQHIVETSSRCQGTSHFSVVTLSTQNACNYSVSICFSTQVVLSVGCTLELLHTFNKTVLMPGWHSRDSNLINLRVGYGDQDFLTLVTLLIKASNQGNHAFHCNFNGRRNLSSVNNSMSGTN